MLFQGKDGELRIHDQGNSGTTHYISVLFTEMDFSGFTSRSRTEESLKMDRGQFSSDAHYVEGPDDPIYAPMPITFSARLADTSASTTFLDLVSGVTQIRGQTIYSRDDAGVSIQSNAVPAFADSGKVSLDVEVLWDGPSQDWGFRYQSVYFTPGEQNLTESADGLILSCNGQVCGDVTRIVAFGTGAMTDLVTA